jgi:hypothetical protein
MKKHETYGRRHLGNLRAENDADGRGSFAVVDRSMPDSLLVSRTLPIARVTQSNS